VSVTIEPSRLRLGDVARVGFSGFRARKLRAFLSALGVAIGIASLVGVLGLSESSKSDLLDQISALGTNLLTIQAGQGFGIGNATLPEQSVGMVSRVTTVESVSYVTTLSDDVFRTDYIPTTQTRGIGVVAADENLLVTLNGVLSAGVFLTEPTTQYPGAVLGSVAAERLGIREVSPGIRILIGDTWVPVIGILEPLTLAPDLDRAVIIGREAAIDYFTSDGIPTTIFLRVDEDWVEATRELLPATVDPENPEEVEVSRPSEALEAQVAAESAFSGLFLGLGAVALLVGGIGIANVMVIGVIERRGEIGLRRAIGATRGHIRRQFLTESLILSAAGGATGVAIGSAVTAAYATLQGWRIIIPGAAVAGGLGAALLIGAVAGLYPAMRAAGMAPTEALRAE
jgi:putative ABC transport system permease protein